MIRLPYCYKLELLNMFVDELCDLKIDLQTDFNINIMISNYNKILNLPMYIKYIPKYLGEEILSINSDILNHIIIKNIGLNITSNISLQRCFLNYTTLVQYHKGYKESNIYLYLDKEDIYSPKYGLAIFLYHSYLKYGIDKEDFNTVINDYIKSTYDKYKIVYGK